VQQQPLAPEQQVQQQQVPPQVPPQPLVREQPGRMPPVP
jgi:hypothetical protein